MHPGATDLSTLLLLTDHRLRAIKPSHFSGSRSEELHRQLRQELSHQIDPSDHGCRPIIPNFFLEVRGNDVPVFVATRKAWYAGALAARGMQALQSYGQVGPVYDNNAYTITASYTGGHLRLYTTHVIDPKGRTDRISHPEYVMTQLGGWSLTGNLESLREGVAAYRNARDWAKEKRTEFIAAANERFYVSLTGEFQWNTKRSRGTEEEAPRESKKTKTCIEDTKLSNWK